GGAIGVGVVDKIPISHEGPKNLLANDSKSEAVQAVTKPEVRDRAEVTPRDAVPLLRDRKSKAREQRKLPSFSKIEANQVTSTLPQALSSPMYSEAPGSGQVGTTANTTLGSRFAGYAAQIRTLVAQQWRTSGIDQRLQNPPQVIVTFELMRNGTIRNLRLLQKSGNSALDLSVLRAIEDAAAPFPPIPPGFEKDYAKVEFTFELKR
ncbi:MAG TPA: TonB family protein, partial [Bryobacteraceae bacterium]|nr:TonB family protein [Bryobacteraceae bacterium]